MLENACVSSLKYVQKNEKQKENKLMESKNVKLIWCIIVFYLKQFISELSLFDKQEYVGL